MVKANNNGKIDLNLKVIINEVKSKVMENIIGKMDPFMRVHGIKTK